MHDISPITLDDGCIAIYLEVPGSKVVTLQAIIEAYEGVATVRTIDIKRSLICVLTTPTMLGESLKILSAIKELVPWRQARDLPAECGAAYVGYQKKGRLNQAD